MRIRSAERPNPRRVTDILTQKAISSAAALNERQRLVRWLYTTGQRQYLDLADRLEFCAVRRRCRSAACPVCASAAQDSFVEAARAYLFKFSAAIACVSLVPADGVFELVSWPLTLTGEPFVGGRPRQHPPHIPIT
jgi:hypothetical protein